MSKSGAGLPTFANGKGASPAPVPNAVAVDIFIYISLFLIYLPKRLQILLKNCRKIFLWFLYGYFPRQSGHMPRNVNSIDSGLKFDFLTAFDISFSGIFISISTSFPQRVQIA